MRAPLLLASATACVAIGPWVPGPVSHTYEVLDLGVLPGGEEAWAFGLNDAGQVALSAQYDLQRRFYHAVFWDEGEMTDLGHLGMGAFHSFATAVNAQGHVVGGSPQDLGFSRRDRAFLHDGTELSDLGALTGDGSSFAFDINDHGDIVGLSATGDFFSFKEILHAVVWSNGQIMDLGTLGGLYSRAHGLNKSLHVVGSSLTADGPTHAFVWNGSMVDLGTLGGAFSEAWDIDDAGRVVGLAQNSDGARRAFMAQNGFMRDLGVLPGAQASAAYGINNAAEVVGTSWVVGEGPHAVLWRGSLILDLNDWIESDTGWTLQVARRINASGKIVGYGRREGRTRAFLLTPPACRREGLRHGLFCNLLQLVVPSR